MFQRVIHQDWAAIIPIISFIVTAGVFILVTVRALRLPKSRRERIARLPLENQPKD
jgi:hypothetical protein